MNNSNKTSRSDLAQAQIYARDIAKLFKEEQQKRKEVESLNVSLENEKQNLKNEIESKKEAETSLLESEDRYRSLIESSHDLIQSFDPSGKFLFFNDALPSSLGYSRDELANMSLANILSPDSVEHCLLIFRQVLNGETVDYFEAKLLTKAGGEIRVEGSATPRFVDGKVIATHAFLRDVTEKWELTQRMNRSQRLESLGTLAGGIAHDINNVLAPIMIGAEMLKDRVNDDVSAKLLNNIERSTDRGSRIVRQILAFARGEEGERVLLNPRHLVREVIEFIRETFPRSITVRMDLAKSLWSIVADATQIHQVILNLAVNARDAVGKNVGTIDFSARNIDLDKAGIRDIGTALKPGKFVELKVTDSGCGISEALIEKIFDPFFTTKAIGAGTGLGLSTVMSIVRSHGGAIVVESEEDKGTSFAIYLPAATDQAEAIQPAEVHVVEDKIPSGGATIMLVDDEEAILDNVSLLLEKNGYAVLKARNGEDALLLFSEEMDSIDLIIIDVNMPVMGGPEAIGKIRKKDSDVPFIMITGSSIKSLEEGLGPLEGVPVLQKPFSSHKLLTAIYDSLQS